MRSAANHGKLTGPVAERSEPASFLLYESFARQPPVQAFESVLSRQGKRLFFLTIGDPI
jgi:hypothetical protein